jgi:hypothetical protein
LAGVSKDRASGEPSTRRLVRRLTCQVPVDAAEFPAVGADPFQPPVRAVLEVDPGVVHRDRGVAVHRDLGARSATFVAGLR